MLPLPAVFLPLYISFVLARPKPTAINERQLLGEGAGDLSFVPPVLTFVTATASTEPTATDVDLTATYAAPTNFSAIYASRTKAEAQELSQFFRTAESTAAAAVRSDLAAESQWQAAVNEIATYTGTSYLFEQFYPTDASAIYASQTKVEAQELSQFFRTAEPTAAAAVSSDLAYESSLDAAFDKYATYTGTSDLLGYLEPTNASAIYASQTKAEASAISQFFRTADPTAKAALSSDLAAQSSFEDKWEKFVTYTGTSDILGFEATSTDALSASRISAAPAATSTAWNINVAPSSQENWPDVAYAGVPAAYGVNCRLPANNNTRRVHDTSGCLETIPRICTSLTSTTPTTNTSQWIFEYSTPTSASPTQCIASYWLPASAAGTEKVPTFEQCQSHIYAKILNICFEDPGRREQGYTMGRVNIVRGLNNDESGGGGKGESQGEQVDAGAPSYQIGFLY